MAGVLISILFFFILFFVLTRRVFVKIIKKDDLIIEIHLPILALILIQRSQNGDKSKNKAKKEEKLSIISYIRLITGIVARIKDAEIVVKSISIPIKSEEFDKSTIIRPLKQHALLCGFIAYLRTKTKNIFIEDNAFILSPDISALQCNITVKLRLYSLIYRLLSVLHGINEEKKRMRIGIGCQRIK